MFRSHVLLLFAFLLIAPPCSGAPPASDTTQVDVVKSDGAWTVPPELTVRARVTAITPAEPTEIAWRHGGEGLGGTVTRGVLGTKLGVGEWSPAIPVNSIVTNRKFPRTLFLTFTCGQAGKTAPGKGKRVREGGSKDVEVEFEFRYRDKVIKQFTESGPNGGTVGVVIPAGRLAGGRTPEDAAFTNELCGILEYAQRRADAVAQLPWAKEPLPKRYAILTDLGGYGEGSGYSIRATDPAVVEAECRTLRQMGVNGLRNAPAFLIEQIGKGEGYAKEFNRIRDAGGMGFPVIAAPRAGGKADPEAGCPFAPGVAERTKAGVEETVATATGQPAQEVWSLTVDEIGSVFDRAPEGKSHVATCPRCAEAFREYLKAQRLSPGDFGQAKWEDVKPLDIFAKGGLAPDAVADRTTALRAYHTAQFANYATAKLFTPLRDTFAKLNDEKRAAAPDAPNGKRPFLYSYALRGNTFLMGGHSLDFFDFYRWSDNGFVYETSNRDGRIWQWDSYLCDVGRTLQAERGVRFGIYVKPHRGAPVQRALSAVSRGATMLYWYTYGPDWSKGDTFAGNAEDLALCSKTARLLAKSEDVLYGATWAAQPEVAVISPRSSEIWMRLSGSPPARVAAWENAKWTYMALAHAHIPVDAIDEGILAEKTPEQLSRYKAIYVNGPNLTVAAAEKLAKWVEAGGTLYTSGGGLVFDEANQPLAALQDVLGLKARKAPEMWRRPKLYGATALESFDEPAQVIAPVPEGAKVAKFEAIGELRPIVGREVLEPGEGTQVIARFADAGAAITRHAHGKGAAIVVGLFPGLEYSAPLRTDHYDVARDLSATWRDVASLPCDGRASPVVDVDRPTVEGVLIRNPSTGRRAITLMNWTYRLAPAPAGAGKTTTTQFVPFDKVKVTVRGRAPASVRSAASGAVLPVAAAGAGWSVVVAPLAEGDVLLLDESISAPEGAK